MNPVEFHDLAGIDDIFLSVLGIGVRVERHPATEAERKIHLSDLVVLGHVGVEVVFPVPNDSGRGGATEEHAGENGALDGEFVENGECAGQAETGRAGMGVRFVGEGSFATAEHLGVRFDLAMDLKPDGDDVV